MSLSAADALALIAFDPVVSQGAAGEPCNLTQSLAAVFAQSPAIQQALSGLPLKSRSVANALMLWDGQWPDDSTSGGQALLRALLIKAVSNARPECQMAMNRGPVLFLVPDRQATVVLAVGSGTWRWRDLVTTNTLESGVFAGANYFSESTASKISRWP